MGTTITKKYVQDRIAARIATLERVIEKGREAEAEYTTLQAKPMRDWLERLVDSTDEILKVLPSAIKSKDADLRRYVDRITQLLPRYYNQPFSSNAESGLRGAIEEGNAAGIEKIKLEHAQAYLLEMPADEFTMTSLKSLGLMEAIKFRIEPEVKK